MSTKTRPTEDASLSVTRERARKEPLIPATLSPDLLPSRRNPSSPVACQYCQTA